MLARPGIVHTCECGAVQTFEFDEVEQWAQPRFGCSCRDIAAQESAGDGDAGDDSSRSDAAADNTP